MPVYNLKKNSIHERYMNLRCPIQIFGGGFGNGKTTAKLIKAIMVMRDYPGCKVLICRETEKKLRSTILPDLFKWLPPDWIKSWNKTDMELVLHNGTIVHFRYLSQKRDAATGDSTGNILGGSYDLIVIDQIEDPGITHKDFLDLLGRRRGNTPYRGKDPTMPRTGPRWILAGCNPTSNWVYRKLVRPYHLYAMGKPSPDLMLDSNGMPMLEVVEGATQENADNLPADYIEVMESMYTGQMRDRYLGGEWANYEGLVYPNYSTEIHTIPHNEMLALMDEVSTHSYNMVWLEGYDHGMRVAACYLLAFIDLLGFIHVVDGFYEPEKSPAQIAKLIRNIRIKYGLPESHEIYADPGIFRRGAGNHNVVGVTVAGMFDELGVSYMTRGNNDMMNGIAKVMSYLELNPNISNPYTHVLGTPLIFFSDQLSFIDQEFTTYAWKRDSSGERMDEPVDRNDHAMDTIKYMLGSRPDAPELLRSLQEPSYMRWHINPDKEQPAKTRNHRYG